MLTTPSAAALSSATLPLFATSVAPDKTLGLFEAATALAQLLGQGRALDTRALHSAMEAAFGASDAEGAWVWKDAYEASEAAQVLFLRKFGGAMRTRAASPGGHCPKPTPSRGTSTPRSLLLAPC
jgi:protein strawberry notch